MTAPSKNPHKAIPGHRFETSAFWRAFPAGMRRRWWLFRPLDLIARHWPVLKRRRGVLVVRMDGIGDMVLFRTSLDYYAEIFGVEKSEVTVLGCKSWGPIADEIFAGYDLRIIEEHDYARRPLYRFKVNLWTRLRAPAATVCDSYFRRALMADSLVWVAAAPQSIVSLPYINEPTRAEFTYYMSQVSRIVNTGVYPTHEVTRHYQFLSALAERDIAPEPPVISWRDAPSKAPAGDPYVVLNPGSNEPGRRWPFSAYLETAAKLLEAGYRVVFVGTMSENETRDMIRGLKGGDRVIDLFGQTTVPELLDVMKQAALVISNDSGPAHLSIALGAPTVVVVGGGHFSSFFPYPDGVAPETARFVYREMECYHCFWRCPKRPTKYDTFPCIEAITVDQVWRAVEDLREDTP